MRRTIIPTRPPGGSSNDQELRDAIDQLKANEVVDDATVTALDTLVKAIPKPVEEINIGCVDGNTVNLATMTLAKNQRIFLYSLTGNSISLKVRFDNTFGKTISVIGATGTPDTDPALITIPNVLSATIYQDFASGTTAINRKTYVLVTTPQTPNFGAVNSDLGLTTWQASAKAGNYVEDVRDGSIWVSRGPGSALKLTQPQALASGFTKVINSNWFDTAFATKYTRKVSKASITSLSLEYKQADGTVRAFTLSDFATGFNYSSYWNGDGDPDGRTRFVSDVETVVVSWDGSGGNLTIGAVAKVGGAALQIRKVKVNGEAIDYLSVYDPSTLPASRVVDTQWYQTAVILANRFYKSCNRAMMTSLSFEYRRPDGTIGAFSATDFTTGFVFSTTWNTNADPSGSTKSYQQGESIVLSFNGAGDRLCIAAFAAGGSILLPVRKISFNGVVEYLSTYDPSTLIDTAYQNRLLFGWTTGVEINTGLQYNSKDVFMQVWEGTTPNNASDNLLVTIAGATRVVNFDGFYKESTADRTNLIGGAYSGNSAHGALFKWYAKTSPVAQELHVYNNTSDVRHQNCAYLVRAWYVK